MHVFLQKSYLASGQRGINAIQNINSGFQVLLASKQVDQVSSPYLQDSTILVHEYWGLYELVSVANGSSSDALHKAGLLGCLTENKNALYLQDRNRPLIMDGSSKIKGNAKIPVAGIKRGYASGNKFRQGKLIDGSTSYSGDKLPRCNIDLVKHNIQNIHFQHIIDVDYSNLYSDSIHIPFFDSPLVLHSSSPLVISHASISGKVILSSNTAVIIKRTCQLDNVLVYAPYIIFEDGCVGSVQAFATDSILLGEDCHLNYPSTLSLLTEDHFENQRIDLGANTTIEGAVLVYREFERKEAPELVINSGAEIYGHVYVDGSINHQGSIYGNVWAGMFANQTMTDAVIDRYKLDGHFAVPNIMKGNQNKVIATWLE